MSVPSNCHISATHVSRPVDVVGLHGTDPAIPPGRRRSRHFPSDSLMRYRRGSRNLGVWPARTILGTPPHREHGALSRQLHGLYHVRPVRWRHPLALPPPGPCINSGVNLRQNRRFPESRSPAPGFDRDRVDFLLLGSPMAASGRFYRVV
jgi:hypothetical protein